MSDILKQVQDDVFAMLQNVPGLSAAYFISEGEKDLESRVKQKIGTANPVSGKAGLVVLVLLPEITEVEKRIRQIDSEVDRLLELYAKGESC